MKMMKPFPLSCKVQITGSLIEEVIFEIFLPALWPYIWIIITERKCTILLIWLLFHSFLIHRICASKQHDVKDESKKFAVKKNTRPLLHKLEKQFLYNGTKSNTFPHIPHMMTFKRHLKHVMSLCLSFCISHILLLFSCSFVSNSLQPYGL